MAKLKEFHLKKNALHEELGVKDGKKLTEKELEKADHSKSTKERERANFAIQAKKWNKR